MNLERLVPCSLDYRVKIDSLEGEKDVLTKRVNDINKECLAELKAEKERKIKALTDIGWKEFLFRSEDDEFSFLEINVIFLFSPTVNFDHFINKKFYHHDGRYQTILFSKAKINYRDPAFEKFEEWFKSLRIEDFVIIGDIF